MAARMAKVEKEVNFIVMNKISSEVHSSQARPFLYYELKRVRMFDVYTSSREIQLVNRGAGESSSARHTRMKTEPSYAPQKGEGMANKVT